MSIDYIGEKFTKAIIIVYEYGDEYDCMAAFIGKKGEVVWKDTRQVGHSDQLIWHPGLGPRNTFALPNTRVVRVYEQLPVRVEVTGVVTHAFPIPHEVVDDFKKKHPAWLERIQKDFEEDTDEHT